LRQQLTVRAVAGSTVLCDKRAMSELDALHPLRLPHLDPADLARRVWTFGRLDQPPYARHVRLLLDGRVAGNLGENERAWRIDDGRLVLLDRYDRRSTVFDRAFIGADGTLALVGPFQAPGGQDHVLREVPPVGGIASSGPPDLVWRRRREPRRNLVVLRANEQSLHHQWPRGIADDDRTWDLCVSFYGREENFVGDDWSEYRILQNRRHKFEALYELLHAGSPFWGYDYIAFPDDDILLSWRDWNELFATCREHRLELAQPALSHDGHITHPITGRDDRYLLRYVSFVEVMTPIFSREALRACAPTFKGSISGFGLDNTWPKLIGDSRDRLAIIDKTPVVHTRPQGAAYSIEEAIQEGNALQWAYDAPSHVLEYGGLFAQPVNRQHAW
jgi:hypothetical protein